MRRIALTLLALTLITTGAAVGQDRGDRGQDRGQDREDRQRGPQDRRGNFDPEQMRQRMMERLKERMGATDEEWEVIEPKLADVTEAQRQTRAGFGAAFGGGRGGFGGPGARGGRGNADSTPVAEATRALGETLEDESADADRIRERLEALREARQKAQEELKTAQDDLREVLTQRQEAMLVMAGMLE